MYPTAAVDYDSCRQKRTLCPVIVCVKKILLLCPRYIPISCAVYSCVIMCYSSNNCDGNEIATTFQS